MTPSRASTLTLSPPYFIGFSPLSVLCFLTAVPQESQADRKPCNPHTGIGRSHPRPARTSRGSHNLGAQPGGGRSAKKVRACEVQQPSPGDRCCSEPSVKSLNYLVNNGTPCWNDFLTGWTYTADDTRSRKLVKPTRSIAVFCNLRNAPSAAAAPPPSPPPPPQKRRGGRIGPSVARGARVSRLHPARLRLRSAAGGGIFIVIVIIVFLVHAFFQPGARDRGNEGRGRGCYSAAAAAAATGGGG